MALTVNRIRRALCIFLILRILFVQKYVYAKGRNRPVVRIFIIAGEANVAGYASKAHLHQLVTGKVDGSGHRDVTQTDYHDLPYRHLWNATDSTWIVRDDVYVAYDHGQSQELVHGPLTAGAQYGAEPNTFGPELQMGHILGNMYDEPVVIIKAGYEGRSLWKDFASPSISETSPGFQWFRMIKIIHKVGNSLHEILDNPAYKYSKPVLGGLVWWHGYTDFKTFRWKKEYGNNLVKFINDIRVELKQPNLPIVVGELGGKGWRTNDVNEKNFRQMQEQVILENFSDKYVAFVPTAIHVKTNPAIQNYTYYFGNAPTMIDISQSFAAALISLNEESEWVLRDPALYRGEMDGFDNALYIRIVCIALATFVVGAAIPSLRGSVRRTWNIAICRRRTELA